MEFRTVVDIPKPAFQIEPLEEMLFVGSCFATSIGQRFVEEKFRAIVNPYGVMYNPASILHTVERFCQENDSFPRLVFFTLGTNHVYRLKETGEIVDNCEKRPAALFQEELLSVDQCADFLQRAVTLLQSCRPDVQVVLTVSPIRYRKYGYHESQLSKATLLLAIEKLTSITSLTSHTSPTSSTSLPVCYFPAYEIVNDELRDYRFYQPDMLHPSQQAVDYIWERLVDASFSDEAKAFLEAWQPLKQALAHKPFRPDSAEYRQFMDKTMLKVAELQKKYPNFAL